MTTFLDEDFSGGTDSAAITTANTAFDQIQGSPTFTSSPVFGGTLAAHCDNTGSDTSLSTTLSTAQSKVSVRLALYMTTLPSANKILINLYNGATHQAGMRVMASGKLDARDGFSAVWNPTTVLSTGTWYQVQLTADSSAGTLSAQLYDASGNTLEDGSGTYSGTTIDHIKVGATQNTDTADWTIDSVVIADTAPGPIVAPSTGQVKAYDGSAWYPVKAWDGSAWRVVKAYDGTRWV